MSTQQIEISSAQQTPQVTQFQVLVSMPVRGLNTHIPTTRLQPTEAAVAKNVRFVSGELQKRAGYSKLSTSVIKTSEQINGIFMFTDSSNAVHYVCCGQTVVKTINITTGAWTDISPAVAPTGTASNFWRCCVVINPADNKKYLILTNGKDEPWKWDGVAATITPLFGTRPGADVSLVFKSLASYASRIIGGNSIENGSNRPLTLFWSSLADMTDWNGLGAGQVSLFDSIGDQQTSTQIQGFSLKSGKLIVYLDESIVPAQLGPDASNAILFPPTQVLTQGLKSPAALTPVITEFGSFDLIQTDNDFVSYDGNSTYPIGLRISRGKDGFNANINAAASSNCFGALSLYNKEWWIFAPFGTNTYGSDIAVFNYEISDPQDQTASPTQTWCYWHPNQIMSSATHATLSTSVTISALSGTIAAQGWQIGGQLSSNYPVILSGGTDGNVYLWSDSLYGDAGTAIEMDFQFPDLDLGEMVGMKGHINTLNAVNLYTRDIGATSLQVTVSTDCGITYKQMGSSATVNFGGTNVGKTTVIPFYGYVPGRTHRVRLYNNTLNQTVAIQGIEFDFTVGPKSMGGFGIVS